MQLTQEHEELRRSVERLIDDKINPRVDAWEDAEIFPAHEVFREFGAMGLLGVTGLLLGTALGFAPALARRAG